ncbi:MAG: hypothetical protein KKC37_14090, partial [Proteobacteria bacterium]|nr:hypothetical protein [Pseudomonadota bacterium]
MAAKREQKAAGVGPVRAWGRFLWWLATMVVILCAASAAGYFVVDHYLTVRRARPWLLKANQALLAGRAPEARGFAARALAVDPASAAALRILEHLRPDKRTSADWLALLAAATARPRPRAIDPIVARRVADLLLRADRALS